MVQFDYRLHPIAYITAIRQCMMHGILDFEWWSEGGLSYEKRRTLVDNLDCADHASADGRHHLCERGRNDFRCNDE